MPFLLKSEPEAYSFADLQRDGETIWDGVTNPVAVNNLRGMKPGDKLIVYHTGKERCAAGTASVVSVTVEGKTPLVRIKAGKPLRTQRTLAEIKSEKLFSASPLVTQGRLSVVPLTDAEYEWLVRG